MKVRFKNEKAESKSSAQTIKTKAKEPPKTKNPDHCGQAKYLTLHQEPHNTTSTINPGFRLHRNAVPSTPGSATVLRTGRTLNCYA